MKKLPKYKFLFYIMAFLNSMFWLYNLTNALMDLLNLVGFLTGINPIILGVTILAWGNSSGGTSHSFL
jgi:Ca2+/Na+ antiporter